MKTIDSQLCKGTLGFSLGLLRAKGKSPKSWMLLPKHNRIHWKPTRQPAS